MSLDADLHKELENAPYNKLTDFQTALTMIEHLSRFLEKLAKESPNKITENEVDLARKRVDGAKPFLHRAMPKS